MFRSIEINDSKLQLRNITDDELPTVSIVTITYNREKFNKLMIRNWTSIDYPENKLEWIIVDDSDNGNKHLLQNEIKSLNDPRIKIIDLPKKIPIGAKRNIG